MIKHQKLLFILLFMMAIYSGSSAESQDILKRFDAVLLITNDLRLASKWQICPDISIVPVHTVEKVYKGEIIDCRVLLRNVTPDRAGNCRVTFDIEIVDPKGRSYLAKRNLSGFNAKSPKAGPILMAVDSLRLSFRESDLPGKYQVNIMVYDHVAGKRVVSGNEVSLIAFGADKPELAELELTDYIAEYYQKPNSHILFELFKMILAVSELQNNGDYAFRMSAMFRTCFKDNPYLIPYLIDYVQSLDYNKRKLIYPVIKAISIDYPDLLDFIFVSEEEQNAIKAIPYPQIWDNNFQDSRELDLLWMSFFASGDILPVRQIVKAVKLKKESTGYQTLIGNEAARSITDYCRRHPLLKAYCGFIYRHDKLDEYTRKVLAKCIADSEKPDERR